jgi:hypothetical protein
VGDQRSVREAVERDLQRFGEADRGCALASSALTLAEALDEGAGLSTAAVARELRATMTELLKAAAKPEEDRVDDLSARRAARRASTEGA